MARKWMVINLLLLAITVPFGRYVLSSIDDFKQKNKLESIQARVNKPATDPDKVLTAPAPPKTYNPAEFSVISEKMVFSETRSNNEEKPDAAAAPAPEAPPLKQKPILVGTSISDNRRLAFIIDPATIPSGPQGLPQAARQPDAPRQPDIQGLAQALSQGDMQGIAQVIGQVLGQGGGSQGSAAGQGSGTQVVTQAIGQASSTQGSAQTPGQGGGMQGIAQMLGGRGGMQGLAQMLGQGGMQGLAQALGQGGMQGIAQALGGRGGMQGLAQALSQSGSQGLVQTVRQRNAPQSTTPRAQIKQVGDKYQGYTITEINDENIVLESGSRKEIIPLHEGSKQPKPGKTTIQPTRVVSIGKLETTGATASAGTTGSRTGTQPNTQQTPARTGTTTQGSASTPQQGTIPRSQPGPPDVPGATPTRPNAVRTSFGDIILPN